MNLAVCPCLLAFVVLAMGSFGECAKGDIIQPKSVRKLVADGKHNAFTALAKWRGQYWLAYRKGPSHAYGEADIIVLRSSDGEKWTETRRVNALPDDRDPELLATPERLFLYHPSLQGAKLTSFVSYTDDGQKWSEPQPVYKPQFIFWKPLLHAGKFYATAHRKAEGGQGGAAREAHLIASTDGLAWKKVSTIRAGNWESETTIHFAAPDRLVAFLRQKYSTPGFILESSAPFTEWRQRPAGTHLSGHCVVVLDGVTYVLSRTMQGKRTGTMIYTFDDGQLRPYCELPSGGDCSYPGAVHVGDEMLVSYYSSHEGQTNIYLARVALQKRDSQPAKAEAKLFVAAPFTKEGEFTKGIEGPACDATGDVFAVNYQKQGTIGRVTPEGRGEVYVTLPGKSVGNGIRFNQQGAMFVADYTQHNILRIDPKTRQVGVFAHEDKMSQPNDLAIGPDGALYASDPNWGQGTGQIWRIDTQGKVTRLAGGLGTTNGIEVSPDGRILYVNESKQRNVWAFTISENTLTDKRLVKRFDDHGFDGMRCDVDGALYISRYGKGTVVKLSPQGKILQEIDVLGAEPSNLCFGGEDGRTVYVTEVEHTRLVRFRVDRPGLSWRRWQESKSKPPAN